MAYLAVKALILTLFTLISASHPAEARHFWQKLLGGGGKQTFGGGPVGLPPSFANQAFTLIDPPIVGPATVGNATVGNRPLTSCTIVAGDDLNFYSTAVAGNGCNIGVTAAGHSNLTTTHVDTLTMRANNAAGGSQALITINNWALPTPVAKTFQVTPPVATTTLGVVQVGNRPQSITQGSCGSCTGFFNLSLNTTTGDITVTTNAAVSGILPGQTYVQNFTATNPAGTVNGSFSVTAVNNLPVVQAVTCNIAHADLELNVPFCNVQATNNPTLFAIASCSANCTNTFQIETSVSTGSSLGRISFKELTGVTAGTTYTLQVTATSSVGTGSAAPVTIVVGPDLTPVVQTLTFPTDFDVIVDGYDIAQIQASNSPTSYGLGSCTIGSGGACTGFFQICATSHICVVAASNIHRSTSYNIVATATNASGTGQATQHINIDAGSISPPVVSATTCTVSVPVHTNDRPCAAVPATNPPNSYSISGCGGYFDIDADTGQYIVTAAGEAAADLNSQTTAFTCHPTVVASNAGGTGSAVQTINSFFDGSNPTGDGSAGSTCTALQLPNLFSTGSGLVAIEVLQGGARSTTNTRWNLSSGGTRCSTGAETVAQIGACGFAGQGGDPTCFTIRQSGCYSTLPSNPVTLTCVADCNAFGPLRPAQPITGNAQWFCPH